MNFEDIVDMEWVDSHTTLDETNEFAGDYYFDHQPDFLLEQPVTPPQPAQESMMEPEIKMEPIANMPTTEQIKQLIEIAKHQLALREQLQQAQAQAQLQSEPSTQQQTQQQQPDQPLFQSLSAQQSDIQTAAPSTIFAPPPPPVVVAPTSTTTPAMPALSPNTITSTDMTLAPPSTVMMDSITEDAAQAQSLSVDNNNNNNNNKARRDSLASMTEESISLEAYAEADGIDLKKLTPKERRQLRNKISARNFRVRRKEYISTLEGQVNEHKLVAEGLREKLVKVEEENKKLRKEMDTLKRQNQILQQQQQQQQQQQKNPASPRISSPLPKPNLNKDISIMGTKASDSYRQQDNCILVSNAVMPVWDYNAILLQDLHQKPSHATGPDYSYMNHLVGQFLLSVVQLASTMPCRTNQMSSGSEYYKPLLPDDRDFTSSTRGLEKESYNATTAAASSSSPSSSTASTSTFNTTTTIAFSNSSSSSSSSSSSLTSSSSSTSAASYNMEDLYDILIQSALINSATADKSFLWCDNNATFTTQH
ncbi:uncharacterized protein ATC70_003821 [Mucor velutinosus]|uniref:BZIP domain-containing protein n=1 Tax=Mucor velutinosus TaxID=708070 RepID=A0AAN7HYA5_9FUNG|nr:hypothetical protein ATC70_003821 [Mucor velutinosus]